MPNNEDKKDRGFTSIQVGTLIEEFRGDIRLLAEGITTLQSDVHILKDDVSQLKTDVRLIKDTLRIAIPDHEKRMTRLELKAAG